MGRFQNFDEVYSALYVDFDNIFTRLHEQDPALARTFATNPQRWMRWLEGHALRMIYGDGVRRRILKRCCYLNPHRYHEFRPYFIRSAFQVVDCPPLTNYGKTSADIHLVMDCMDALAHVTRFDEIIIISGDADFTPLLLRIQEHARRSLVLSVGYTSPAYVAACSWRIREDWFIAQALEEPRPDDEREERYADNKNHAQDKNRQGADEQTDARTQNAANAAGGGESRPARNGGSVNLPVYKRIRLVEAIKQLVVESSVPVPLPSVAQVLQSEQEASPDWYGAGTLRDLIEALDISPMEFSGSGQGFVYDPERHDRPEDNGPRDDFRQRRPDLYEFALKVNRLADLPLLTPEHYTRLLHLLAEEVDEQGFARAETLRHVEDSCEDEGLPVTTAQIAFVAEAIIRGGYALAAISNKERVDMKKMRRAFFQRAVELCRLAQLSLNPAEQKMLEQWLFAE